MTRFREVLPKVKAVFDHFSEQYRAGYELTAVRDVQGRVRVVLEGTSKPAEVEDAKELETKLRAAVGEWVGDPSPVWRVRVKRENLQPSEKAVLEQIYAHAQPATEDLPRRVERHVSREAWAGLSPYDPPWARAALETENAPPIITFFSQKGGVGRTTALVATGLLLAREGLSVVLVDLDLEAPGLDTLFLDPTLTLDEGVLDLLMRPPGRGSSASNDQKQRADAKELADAVSAATYTLNEPSLVGEGTLRVVTAGKVDDLYIEMLARMDGVASANRGVLLHQLQTLFRSIRAKWKPDWILVDARAGLHDLGGLMLASLSHAAVMVLTANPQSEHGLRRVARLLRAPYRHGGQPCVPLVLAHGLAPPPGSGGAGEREGLKQRAHDILTEEYYPPNSPPGLEAKGVAHDPVPLPWVPALRGQGGKLDPEVADLLRAEPYQQLVERLKNAVKP